MTNAAVFPLALVRDCLRAPARSLDANLCDRFGYMHAKHMTPAVIYSARDYSRTHCGALPLVAWVGYKFSPSVFDVVRGCYINVAGEHVFPG